ncbi:MULTISPECIES: bacteriocin fulvocin C-related protein [unclassified Streptomyces]|uniref:bacteriocin fulvocin C-related protein n=1 Tax=unclassified Streptomyces TaxID=2593676 RepID=UPI0033B05967
MAIKRTTHWVLAFDDGCGTCREISAVVEEVSQGRLRVMPLRNPEVERWRTQRFGAQPPWAPTLFRLSDAPGAEERGVLGAWTGPRMAAPLMRVLGPRSALRVLHALGGLRRRAAGKPDALPDAPRGRAAVSRAQFLRYTGGAVVAAGLVLTGKTPAFAAQEEESAHKWAARRVGEGRLPQTYGEVVRYPQAYRKAVHSASTPQVRSALWSDHLSAFEGSRKDLLPAQRSVLRDARSVAAEPSNFVRAKGSEGVAEPLKGRLEELHRDAVDAFGAAGAHAMLANLGPAGASEQASGGVHVMIPDCGCSVRDPYCVLGACEAGNGRCRVIVDDCGTFYAFDCDGGCPGIPW